VRFLFQAKLLGALLLLPDLALGMALPGILPHSLVRLHPGQRVARPSPRE
jgi:hypothetical protein